MGKGGQQESCMEPTPERRLREDGKGVMVSRVPTAKPPFSLADVRRAIPPHCFQRSTLRSFSYLAVDLLAVVALGFAATFIEHPAVPRPLAWLVLWPLYWFWQVSLSDWGRGCGRQALWRGAPVLLWVRERPSEHKCSQPLFPWTS